MTLYILYLEDCGSIWLSTLFTGPQRWPQPSLLPPHRRVKRDYHYQERRTTNEGSRRRRARVPFLLNRPRVQ